jgi:hypothetical protein
MGTQASDIFDLFMSSISDYKLDTIFEESGSTGLSQTLEPWLLFSIVDFEEICDQGLDYTKIIDTGTGDGAFAVDLTNTNQVILSLLMLRYWMERQVQDVFQMHNFIQDHDFKRYSEANNLRAKSDYLRQIIERLNTRLVEYGYDKNDWTSWKNQVFD